MKNLFSQQSIQVKYSRRKIKIKYVFCLINEKKLTYNKAQDNIKNCMIYKKNMIMFTYTVLLSFYKKYVIVFDTLVSIRFNILGKLYN